MSTKVTKRIFVRMSKKELSAWLADHPNAQYNEFPVTIKRVCDICGKRINENKYWASGYVQFVDYHESERCDLCSDACTKEFMRRASAQFENQSPDATNKITGITVHRLDDAPLAKDSSLSKEDKSNA